MGGGGKGGWGVGACGARCAGKCAHGGMECWVVGEVWGCVEGTGGRERGGLCVPTLFIATVHGRQELSERNNMSQGYQTAPLLMLTPCVTSPHLTSPQVTTATVHDRQDLSEQIEIFKGTSLLVYPHGATMAHAIFLPKGAVALEVIPWPNVSEPHGWLQVGAEGRAVRLSC